MRGFNEDEIADFADFAREHEVDVRLIEFMPLDSSRAWSRASVVSADEMLEALGRRHDLVPLDRGDPASTSLDFAFADGGPGRIGIIAPVTRSFCGACSRLRVTADGKVRPCPFSREEWDLRPILRNGGIDRDVARFIADSMWTKQADHGIGTDGFAPPPRTMSAIGG
jgi:cyclic pyranopterin phosphate synthase